MGEPARRNAEGPAPQDDPERKPGPRAAAWGDVRDAVIINSQAVALAAAEVAARPGDTRAGDMLELTLQVLARLASIAGRCTANEAEFEVERERGFAEGYAARDAERCRLGVIDGGRAGPH